MLTHLDVNSDMGESDEADILAIEAEMMPRLSSVSVACGGHAGTVASMRRTASLAACYGVAIGAHPGFPDRAQFGRAFRDIDAEGVTHVITTQVATLSAVVESEGLSLRHVKLHGALYHQAAHKTSLARGVVEGLLSLTDQVWLFAPAGSILVAEARAAGVPVVEEVFADRAYRADGTLVPRSSVGAVLRDAAEVARQVQALLEGAVPTVDGRSYAVHPGSLCLHSDTPGAVPMAAVVRQVLDQAGVRVCAPAWTDH